jgi:hypothetical protein
MKLLAGIAAGIVAAVTGIWFWLVRKEQKKTDPAVYNKEQD